MPTSTFTPGDERQEEKLNPGQQDYDRRFNDIAKAEEQGTFNDAANTYDQTADSSQEDANAAKVRNNEASSAPNPGWTNNVTDGKPANGSKFNLKSFVKKRGPIAAILSALGIGGFGLTVLFSPSMLLIHMKETLSEKFNDQLAVLDTRSGKIMAKKLTENLTSGVCEPIKIRCKYQTLSKREIARFNKAGIQALDKDGNPLSSRGKAVKLKVGDVEYDAQSLQRELRRNPQLRSTFNRAYNPRFTSFTDKLAQKINSKLKISRKNTFEGLTTKEEMNKKLRATVNGEGASVGNPRVASAPDEEGNFPELDDDGKPTGKVYTQAQLDDLAKLDTETAAKKALLNSGDVVAKSTVKGALTVTAFGAGAVDSVCTGYRMIRAVGFAAKYIGMLQLTRYAYAFSNSADVVKAGDSTPEQAELWGNILTSANSQGKTATDSYGFKYAAYGDTAGKPSSNVTTDEEAVIADETLRYTNGQLVSQGVMATIVNLIPSGGTTEAADQACDVVKSGWGQAAIIGTAVVGAVTAFFTAGASLSWGAAAQIGASAAIGVAMGMLMPKLVDMASGALVTGDENGNEAGNAIVSGTGAYNAQVSQGRGLAVLTKEDAVAYQNLNNETVALYNEAEKLEASPLDATNKNTFIGSFVSKFIPFVQKGDSLSPVTSVLGSFSAASTSILSNFTAKAATVEEFDQCDDPEYNNFNGQELAADPFCNLRYGLDNTALGLDPETVLDYMVTNGHINEGNGEPESEIFKQYIENCVDRTNSIGGYTDPDDAGNDAAKGADCIQGNGGANEERNTYFRVYLVDKSVIDEMDDEPLEAVETAPTGSAPGGVSTGRPDNVKSLGQGWTLQANVDYSAAACAPGSSDEGLYTHPVEKFTFRKCRIGSAWVNSLVSQAVVSMIEAAKSQGVTLSLGNSFRSYEEQEAVYRNNCHGGSCSPPTAKPGNSQHERGLAIDFTACGNRSTACYKWMAANGATYGYYNLPSEAWHWSMSGY